MPEQTSSNLTLSIAILAFGLVVIIGVLYVILKKNQGFGPNSVSMVGITLIIVTSLFLVTSGYAEKQITPVIGLLSTIVGFFLANVQRKSSPSNQAEG